MRGVQLNKPYKISFHKIKRYSAHYGIPAEKCVVIPMRSYGEECVCDVRWEDANGELQVKERLFIAAENIEPLNEMNNFALHELWQHYYGNGASAATEKSISQNPKETVL
jgi:hypothetical protein